MIAQPYSKFIVGGKSGKAHKKNHTGLYKTQRERERERERERL